MNRCWLFRHRGEEWPCSASAAFGSLVAVWGILVYQAWLEHSVALWILGWLSVVAIPCAILCGLCLAMVVVIRLLKDRRKLAALRAMEIRKVS